MFLRIPSTEKPQNNFSCPKNLFLRQSEQVRKKRGNCHARSLLQCCQLLDKISRNISRYLHLELFAIFQTLIYFFHNSSRKILRCCAELWSGNLVLTSD